MVQKFVLPKRFSGAPTGPVCRDCGEPISGSNKRVLCDPCKLRVYRRRRRLRRERTDNRQRDKVYAALGGRCHCCPENRIEFLTVEDLQPDHVDANSQPGLVGTSFAHVVKQGIPKDRYRLTCWNCTFARFIYGYCPHMRRDSDANSPPATTASEGGVPPGGASIRLQPPVTQPQEAPNNGPVREDHTRARP